jgi:hypothetical protein
MKLLLLFPCIALAAACSATGSVAPPDLASPADLAPIDKAANCASTFGNALTAGFGRFDGTLVAVVPPGHPTCPLPNSDHIVLQIRAGGDIYRMVVNVQSSVASDPNVRYSEKSAPLGAPAFADGWHLGVALDYVSTLNAHSTEFTPTPMADLVAQVTARLDLDTPVSVYSTTSGGNSTHLVHRNAPNADGAIVIQPTSSTPTYMLFSFENQTF